MSLVNFQIIDDGGAGLLLTDTASICKDTGVVLGPTTKVFTVPHARLALATAGPVLANVPVTVAAAQFDEFDALVNLFPSLLRQTHMAMVGRMGRHDIDIVVVGWSAAKQCVRAVHARSPNFEFGFYRDGLVPPVNTDEIVEGDPVKRMLAIAEKQRTRFSYWDFPGGRGIGGGLILTRVERDRIEQRIVHDWADKIGERIGGVEGSTQSNALPKPTLLIHSH